MTETDFGSDGITSCSSSEVRETIRDQESAGLAFADFDRFPGADGREAFFKGILICCNFTASIINPNIYFEVRVCSGKFSIKHSRSPWPDLAMSEGKLLSAYKLETDMKYQKRSRTLKSS